MDTMAMENLGKAVFLMVKVGHIYLSYFTFCNFPKNIESTLFKCSGIPWFNYNLSSSVD